MQHLNNSQNITLNMSRNSIEKRSTMLQKTWLNHSRCNPESSTSIAIPSSAHLHQLYKNQKNIESTTSIKNFNSSIGNISSYNHIGTFNSMLTGENGAATLENRYQALQKMYKGLLTKISMQKNSGNQEKEIEIERRRYQVLHEKNQKEIKRLRGMLGFLDKKDMGVQTHFVQQVNSCEQNQKTKSCTDIYKKNHSCSKDNSKMGNSKIKLLESQSNLGSPKNTAIFNQTAASRSAKYLFSEPQNRKTRNASPSGLKQKFKFIPSLQLA